MSAINKLALKGSPLLVKIIEPSYYYRASRYSRTYKGSSILVLN